MQRRAGGGVAISAVKCGFQRPVPVVVIIMAEGLGAAGDLAQHNSEVPIGPSCKCTIAECVQLYTVMQTRTYLNDRIAANLRPESGVETHPHVVFA